MGKSKFHLEFDDTTLLALEWYETKVKINGKVKVIRIHLNFYNDDLYYFDFSIGKKELKNDDPIAKKLVKLIEENYYITYLKTLTPKSGEGNQTYIFSSTENVNLLLEITKPRFYVDENIFRLLWKKGLDFKLNVIPKKGKHPKGFYMVPHMQIMEFILSKRVESNNWEKNKNFHQDTIPSALKEFFTCQ